MNDEASDAAPRAASIRRKLPMTFRSANSITSPSAPRKPVPGRKRAACTTASHPETSDSDARSSFNSPGSHSMAAATSSSPERSLVGRYQHRSECPRGGQPPQDVMPDESRAASDCDFHGTPAIDEE